MISWKRLIEFVAACGLVLFVGCSGSSGNADALDEVVDLDVVVSFGDASIATPPEDSSGGTGVTSSGPDLIGVEVRHPDIPKVDLPPPADDADNDGIPDLVDPFPNDDQRPGTSSAMSVYMHTADELWKLDVKSHEITKVGDFAWPSGFGGPQMTDIAIDRWGVLYGVSFDDAYVCSPVTAECWLLGVLPDSFNGLTLVPQGTLSPDKDVLVGVAGDGGWYSLSVMNGEVYSVKLGSFGGPYSSSGDAYSIAGVGTFAAANKTGAAHDVLVRLEPTTGQVQAEVGPLTGYASVYGLAGWTGKAYAFDASGDIVVVDSQSGAVLEVLQETSQVWWGAGVRTLVY